MGVKVLLSVLFVITLSAVEARPSDIDSKTKRSANIESDKGVKPSDSILIKFPIALNDNFHITINGHLALPENPTIHDILEIIIPLRDQKEEDHCIITYNYKTKESNVNSEAGYITASGEVLQGPPSFILNVSGQSADGAKSSRSLQVNFNPNYAFNLSRECTNFKSFEDLEHIHLRSGFHNITQFSLQF